ncbi:hypothetical protein QOT17_012801 [Balamuthia mandrillaris]
MLERKACVVPHELFLAEPPPINANPILIVTYDLSKRADCKGLLDNASKPTLWYLPLDTMTGDPLDQWSGVPVIARLEYIFLSVEYHLEPKYCELGILPHFFGHANWSSTGLVSLSTPRVCAAGAFSGPPSAEYSLLVDTDT